MKTSPKSASVQPYKGRPTIFVDGVPMTPDFYSLTHNYAARWSWEERQARNLRNFAAAGIRLYQVDMYFEEIWRKGAAQLDIALLQKQVGGVLAACPEACVVVRVHVNAPFWWNDDHPDELTGYCTGPADKLRDGTEWSIETGDLERSKRASLASTVWRREAGLRLAELCTRLADTPEGGSVVGIHVCCGVFGEWHYWAFLENEPDTGPAMTRQFREWLSRAYGSDDCLRKAWGGGARTIAGATVPEKAERDQCYDGFFRDSTREQRVIDYYRCQHEVVADDIEYFCRIVKQSWPRPVITGVFYGYFHMMFCKQAAGGHLCIERILNSPWIDYLSAPQAYWKDSRELGGSGNSRGIVESAILHGKLWLDEMDNGGIRKDPEDPGYFAVATRSAALPLARGTGLWYYDFGFSKELGWWESPVIMRDAAAIKTIFDRELHEEFGPAADALVVWDDEVFYYMKNGWTPVSYAQLDMAAEDIWRSGVAADHIYLFDIEKADLGRYRAVIFANIWCMTSAQRALVRNRIAADGRLLLWNYLPGYIDNGRADIAHVEHLTGMKVTRKTIAGRMPIVCDNPPCRFEVEAALDPAVVITDASVEPLARLGEDVIVGRLREASHTTVFSAVPLREPAIYREILRDAGCHIYSESNDPVFATQRLVMLHTGRGSRRDIVLRNGKKVSVDLTGPATVLLDAQTGERKL